MIASNVSYYLCDIHFWTAVLRTLHSEPHLEVVQQFCVADHWIWETTYCVRVVRVVCVLCVCCVWCVCVVCGVCVLCACCVCCVCVGEKDNYQYKILHVRVYLSNQ